MVIELRGLEFVNKGAELMLHSILQKVREEIPNVVFVMEHSPRAPRKKQIRQGIYTKTNIRRYRLNFKYIFNLIPRKVRRKFFFISENEIDVVLDGSGFAYGDFWGAEKAGQRLADHIKKWNSKGIKVILLPQAFGPFTDPKLILKLETITNYADLIFARDKYSFEYISTIGKKKDNVYLMPDFTNLISGEKPSYFNESEEEIAIIPNSKLIESNVFSFERYLEILNLITEYITKNNFTPFFLVHEGVKDLKLVEAVNEKYQKNVKIIVEDDPILVKGIIGNSKGVVTSRFHGLVSSLCQAVPCLCIGWSHKYQALMEDYNYEEGLIKSDELTEIALSRKIDLILDESSRKIIYDKLKLASRVQKEYSMKMWDKVFDIIEH